MLKYWHDLKLTQIFLWDQALGLQLMFYLSSMILMKNHICLGGRLHPPFSGCGFESQAQHF